MTTSKRVIEPILRTAARSVIRGRQWARLRHREPTHRPRSGPACCNRGTFLTTSSAATRAAAFATSRRPERARRGCNSACCQGLLADKVDFR